MRLTHTDPSASTLSQCSGVSEGLCHSLRLSRRRRFSRDRTWKYWRRVGQWYYSPWTIIPCAGPLFREIGLDTGEGGVATGFRESVEDFGC